MYWNRSGNGATSSRCPSFNHSYLHQSRHSPGLTCYDNKSVFGFVRQLSTWHCPHLLLSAVQQARRVAIERYLMPAGRSAANPQQRRAAGE